jgi:hypothetical protein
MDRQDNLTRRVIDVDDDVGDQGPQEPLARAHCHSRRIPRGTEIVRQAGEVGRGDGATRSPRCLQPSLAGLHTAQRRLPALLKLGGDQTIVGIAGGITPFRERGFVPRLLQLQFDDALLFVAGFHVPPLGLGRRFDRHRRHGPQKLAGDRGVDPQAAEGEATGQPEHQVRAIAPVDGLPRRAT